MADDDIRGTVTDSGGNPVQGATVVAFEQDNIANIASVTTDSNGNYVIDNSNLSGDGPWHVTARWDDGSGNQFNSLSKPYVSANISSAIPDSGLVHRYDAQSESGASTFTDQQGSKDLSAGGGPSLVTDGINGNQSMFYDGSDDQHTDSSPISLGTGNAYTVACVIEPESLSDRAVYFNNGDGNNNGIRFFDGSSQSEWRHYHDGSIGQGWGGINTNPHVFVATYDGTTLIIDENKTEQLNKNAGISAPTVQFSIGSLGGKNYAHVSVGELLWYDVSKNVTERDEITDFLADRWGITL